MPSIYLLLPLTEQCKVWLTENVSEEAMYLGHSLAVEHRYVETLVMGYGKTGLCLERILRSAIKG